MSFINMPISITSLFNKGRRFADINVNVVVNESTTDTLTITKQPVQMGASITDHAYKEPTVFSTNIFLNDNATNPIAGAINVLTNPASLLSPQSALTTIYQKLLDLQSSRLPFDIVTPKRVYTSMLLQSLGVTTDKTTENVLSIHATFQQILIVNVTTASVPRINQKFPGVTDATQTAGNKSALQSLAEGVGAIFRGR